MLELDVMVDKNLEPWLLGVDRSPNLACATPLPGQSALAANADRQVAQRRRVRCSGGVTERHGVVAE